jgi:uncharacterized protein YdeI (YjbR/CyaY-like superfamily)
MADFIRDTLNEHGLMYAYHIRSPYQQNDYLGWLTRAKRAASRQKRLHHILDELEGGAFT